MLVGGRYTSLIVEAGDAFHPASDPTDRVFLLIRYYIDVAGKKADHRVVTAGGYLASQEQWDAFETSWGLILDRAGAPYFHATDFFGCYDVFKHIRKGSDWHKELGRMFANAAHLLLPIGFAQSIDLHHYDRELREVHSKIKTPHDRVEPASFVVGLICLQAARKALFPTGARAVAFIEDGDGVGEIIEWLLHLKRVGEPWTAAFENFAPISKMERPVQAADLLAHEAWLETRSLLENPARTWGDTRDIFRILATGPNQLPPEVAPSKVEIHQATKEHFEATARRLPSFYAAHPEYLKKPRKRRWKKELRKWAKDQRSIWKGRMKKAWYTSKKRLGL